VYNPATGQVQARVLLAGTADVDQAVQTAKKAYAAWQDVSLTRRARIMFAFRNLVEQHADDLARLVSAEHGKVISDAKGEVIRGLEVVEFACGIPQLLKGEFSDQVSTHVGAYSFRQPLGVCAGSPRSTSRPWSRCGCTRWPRSPSSARPRSLPTCTGAPPSRASGSRRSAGRRTTPWCCPTPIWAFYSFGGWKDSLFGDTHVHGAEGIRFYTRAKAITTR